MNKIGFISTGNNLTMIVYKNQKDRANPYYVYSERTIWKDRGDGLEQPHKSRKLEVKYADIASCTNYMTQRIMGTI